MKRLPLYLIVVVFLIAFKTFWPHSQHEHQSANTSPNTAQQAPASAPPVAHGNMVSVSELPSEAQQTLSAIKQGGPFAYDRDGVVFGNFEKRLPFEPRGYYHEYTVKTPGAHNRGARRIIAGGNPPRVFFYTDDHYQSFRRIGD